MKKNKSSITLSSLCGIIIALSTSCSVMSKEYKTILIHGLQPQQLISASATNVEADGASYWSSYWGQVSDERIDWPSYERIEGKIATDWIWPKLKQFSEANLCDSGCVLVTHSTGDLVARYIIDNQANWLRNAGLQPLNIVATFDIAGAGGGSELADIAVSALTGAASWSFVIDQALTWWLGSDVTEAVGVLHDLKVNNARKISPVPDDRAPRLRFVADGDDFFGATKLFLKGSDDGVVASHSSCGASRVDSFSSCSRHIASDGQVGHQGNGVSGFMPNHYPMLMSDNYSHNSIRNAGHKGKVTVANYAANVGGKQVSFQTYDETTGHWFWKKQYRFVADSNRLSASELIYDAIP
ncbi:hypothetical protein [Pseudoalteromonas sp. MMG005]|uniref:hypothetical protein n=1 Tax=Pseudoalteromonas sp. MMG005 TaxID=2822682 RepID=UPI001B3A6480|nr:hypothetical protein [Pseudoalteromonas sp. MMG005]MBQ4845931.1 hypothetical protein [Pseudoalteromonas sp. MMG005]